MTPALTPTVGDRRGITLVEVIVAVGIITVGLSALLAAVPFASYGTREGYQLSTATFLANERLEQVRNARWESEPRPLDELGVSPAATSAPKSGAVTTFADEAALPAPYERLRARRPHRRLRERWRVQRDRECRSPAGHDHRDLPPDDRRRRRRHRRSQPPSRRSSPSDDHADDFVRFARAAVSSFGTERGVALPMALLSLVILSALIAGFLVMSAIEPTIANNQLAVAQARALAEAGVERALWALSNPADAQGIPATFTTAPSPYDGGRLVPVAAGGHAVGGFRVTVTNGPTRLRAPHHRGGLRTGRRARPRRPEDHRHRAQPSAHRQGPAGGPLRARRAPGERARCGWTRAQIRAAGQRSGRSRAARRHSRARPRTFAAPAAMGPRETGSPTRREASSLPHPG